MPASTAIETEALSSGHPYARIGSGPRIVLYLPGLSFTAEPSTPKSIRRWWKAWLEPIDRHGLTFVEVGRRADLRVLAIDADSDETHDATAHLADIRCPTLVLGGELDPAYPSKLVRELVARIPDVRHVEYPNVGHAGPGARFAEEACAFLAAIDRDPPRNR